VRAQLEELRVETLARDFAVRMVKLHSATVFPVQKKNIRFTQMSVPHFRLIGGALRLNGARRMNFVMDPPVLPAAPVVVEVPTAAAPTPEPEPAVVEVPTAAAPTPEPEPAVVEVPTAAAPAPEPEPAVVEVPTAAPEPPSEVEAPPEVPETAPEAGLVPENPSTE